jgi:hypothetical protein
MGATDILYEVAMLMTAGLTSRRRFQAFDRTVSENDTVFFLLLSKLLKKRSLKTLLGKQPGRGLPGKFSENDYFQLL